jgi:hypothetical protein
LPSKLKFGNGCPELEVMPNDWQEIIFLQPLLNQFSFRQIFPNHFRRIREEKLVLNAFVLIGNFKVTQIFLKKIYVELNLDVPSI